MAQEKETNAMQHLLRVVRGNSFLKNYSLSTRITDDQGVVTEEPIDLTNSTVYGYVKENFVESGNKLEDFTAVIVDAVNGEFDVSLTALQTGNMVAGNYVYEILVTDATSTTTYLKGTFRVDLGDNV